MRISRENYEMWFASWLDNQLTAAQQEELKVFLNENPDLENEFNAIAGLILDPSSYSFPGREKLKRKTSEIPADQFELLCAASLEGDLGPEQLSELSEITGSDPEKNKTAALFSITKLNPSSEKYPFKRSLYRRTTGTIIFRLAAPVIGIAAMVAIAMMTGFLRKHVSVLPETTVNLAQTPVLKSPGVNAPVIPDGSSVPARNKRATTGKVSSVATSNDPSITTANTSAAFQKQSEIIPLKIKPAMQIEIVETHLAQGPAYTPPRQISDTDDERSRIGKFLARAFREKVLEEQSPSDKPLKGYEIAEAGITGINKIFGWEMALTKNTSDDGLTSSVNFNSRLLKFNTPVKNNSQRE